MNMRNAKKLHIILTAMITVAMVTTLVLPLQAESASAASSTPTFSNKSVIKPKLTSLKKKKKAMNLRLEAKQPVGGYDTIQGSCYGGGYIYYLLNDRIKDKCKVVKMRRSDLKVTKVSKPLTLNHGNDMTYNTRTGKIVVSNGKPSGKRLTVINSKTLTVEKAVTVEINKSIPGIRWERIKDKGGYVGFNNVAYNHAHDQYVVQLYSTRDFLFLDANFNPVRYVKPTDWEHQMYQGLDSFGDRIVVCNSYSSGRPNNTLSVYDWDGNYLSMVNFGRGKELESVFHQGSQLYVSYYTSYWAKYRWVIKSKKAKKKVKVKVKVRTKSGKYKYVTKTKKKRVKVWYYAKKRKLGKSFLNRDGFVYKVTGL